MTMEMSHLLELIDMKDIANIDDDHVIQLASKS